MDETIKEDCVQRENKRGPRLITKESQHLELGQRRKNQQMLLKDSRGHKERLKGSQEVMLIW